MQGEARIGKVRAAKRHQIGTAGGNDGVHLVGRGDAAHAHYRHAGLVAQHVGPGKLEHSAIDGRRVMHRLPGRDVDQVAAGGTEGPRDGERVGVRDAALRPVGGADAHRHRPVLRPGFAQRGEDFQREAEAVRDASTVFIGSQVQQGRKEGRQQVAMGAVQLQHVEAAGDAAPCRRHELGFHAVHVGARHGPRHLAVREVGRFAGRDDGPGAGFERLVHALPHELRRTLAAGMAELEAHAGAMAVRQRHDAGPGRLLRVVPQAGAAGGDACPGARAGHLGEDEAGAPHGTRAVMREVEILRQPVLGRVHAHGRDHDAVGKLHPAQAEGLEHGRLPRLPARRVPRHRRLDLQDEFRRTEQQVVPGDGLGARHHAEGEAGRVEVPEALHLLEPDERHVRRVLCLLHVLPARGFEVQQALGHAAGAHHGAMQRNGVLHG
jgi:hypothetical protein